MTYLTLESFASDPSAVPHLATCEGCNECRSYALVLLDTESGQSVRIPRQARRVLPAAAIGPDGGVREETR